MEAGIEIRRLMVLDGDDSDGDADDEDGDDGDWPTSPISPSGRKRSGSGSSPSRRDALPQSASMQSLRDGLRLQRTGSLDEHSGNSEDSPTSPGDGQPPPFNDAAAVDMLMMADEGDQDDDGRSDSSFSSSNRASALNGHDSVSVVRNRETLAQRNRQLTSNRYNNLDELLPDSARKYENNPHAPSLSAQRRAFTLYDDVVPGFLSKMFYTSQFQSSL